MIKRIILLLAMTSALATNLSAQQTNDLVVGNVKKGQFIQIAGHKGKSYRAYAAGPAEGKLGILFVHDYFGITESAKESVELLGAMGYRTIAVDLYNGRSATTHDSAVSLMKGKDSLETVEILQAGIDWLNKPGIKLAAIGFSAGGVDAMNATLLEPELFKATIIVYGGG
ncbi:MAG TPA: dienelactone hydrolase family protein, partial [Chitinophagaceae bacterium]